MRSIVLLCLLLPGLAAASAVRPWSDVPARTASSLAPDGARLVAMDFAALSEHADDIAAARVALSLPLPEGGTATFLLEDSGTLPPALAARYPEIRSLRGRDDQGRRLRLDLSPGRLQAMVFDEGRTWVIAPASDAVHAVFDRGAVASHSSVPFSCGVHSPTPAVAAAPLGLSTQTATGLTRYEYRLAVAATGEYTAFHGGSVAQGLAAVAAVINRVNEIYEADLGVHLTLVADNDAIIYTNAGTDPYSNSDGIAMLGENQSNLDAVIGPSDYDVGHVFSTGGGGVASLSVVCSGAFKARGVTGQGSPIGDPFAVDYVAHELGHQFGANHTFNGTSGACGGGNRAGSAAYEPGSGSTVMAYAGICGSQDLQPNSDPYFHAKSIAEVAATLPFDTCAAQSSPANLPPTVQAQAPHTIPARTPFRLVADASDPDGDLLRFAWEQYDLGASQASAQPLPTAASGPIIRSFDPTLDAERTVPRLSTLLGGPAAHSEVLPATSRPLTFRLTVRDDAPGAGATQSVDLAITVEDTGAAFAVTEPDAGSAWSCGAAATVEWDVAGTDAAPISCAAVDLELSTDGGVSYPHLLAAGVPNTGTALVQPPALESASARVRVSCSDNLFFALSPADFTLEGGDPAVAADDTLDAVLEDSGLLGIPGADLLANDTPAGILVLDDVLAIEGGIAEPYPDLIKFIPAADFHGNAVLAYTVTGGCGGEASANVTIPVLPVNDAPALTLAGDLRTVADAGSGSVPGFVTGFSAGPGNESGQLALGYALTIDDPDGVLADVSLATSGSLSWTLTGVEGTAQLAASVQDDGGTDHGGVDQSAPVPFSLQVLGTALFRDSFETD